MDKNQKQKMYANKVMQESIEIQNRIAPILADYRDPNAILTTLTRLLVGAIAMARHFYPEVDEEAALNRILDTIRYGVNEEKNNPRVKELYDELDNVQKNKNVKAN